MTATATRTEPTVVAAHKVEARAQGEWFAFTGNPYYAHLKDTPSIYVVEVKRTIHGEHYVSTRYATPEEAGRTQVHAFAVGYRSLPFATEAEARQEANRVWTYLRDAFVSDFGVQAPTTVAQPWGGLERGKRWHGDAFGQTPRLSNGEPAYTTPSLCPDCQHFGTLTTRQEAYGDSTTCSTEGCTYSRWYSIGD